MRHSLAFVTLKNNLMVLSLRAMIVQFIVLMLLAAMLNRRATAPLTLRTA